MLIHSEEALIQFSALWPLVTRSWRWISQSKSATLSHGTLTQLQVSQLLPNIIVHHILFHYVSATKVKLVIIDNNGTIARSAPWKINPGCEFHRAISLLRMHISHVNISAGKNSCLWLKGNRRACQNAKKIHASYLLLVYIPYSTTATYFRRIFEFSCITYGLPAITFVLKHPYSNVKIWQAPRSSYISLSGKTPQSRPQIRYNLSLKSAIPDKVVTRDPMIKSPPTPAVLHRKH